MVSRLKIDYSDPSPPTRKDFLATKTRNFTEMASRYYREIT